MTKRFGATVALAAVDLDLRAGEVHVLAGANGAGKSTLIKILSGVHRDYQGELRVDGRTVRFAGPRDAARAGIATIHQELSLVGPLSVADNLALGDAASLWGWVAGAAHRRRAERALGRVGLDLDPSTETGTLPLGQRQLCEIARALEERATILVMDEPTSALGAAEVDRLFEQVRALRAQGAAVLLITHRIEEIFRIADRISVLRDGRLVCSRPARELDEAALVGAMVGCATASATAPNAAPPTAPLLLARGLSVTRQGRTQVEALDIALGAGEVLGLAGLEGSGASELLHALVGHRATLSGPVRLADQPYRPRDPREALGRGVVLVTGDRSEALVGPMSVIDNALLSSVRRAWIDRRDEARRVAAVAGRIGLAAGVLAEAVARLSGGNQQKVVLARALLARPRLLLLDEPTRGIDVAARADVHRLVGELGRDGVGVIVSSTEVDELLALCHRVLVLARGRMVRVLGRGELDRAAVLGASLGHKEQAS